MSNNLLSEDFEKLDAELLRSAKATLQGLFPAGKIIGNHFVMGNVRGDAGNSLKFNLKSGVWKDFGSSEAGFGIISLLANSRGIKQSEAFRQLGGVFTNKNTNTNTNNYGRKKV